jgi:anti-anti-sigma regulatory factor
MAKIATLLKIDEQRLGFSLQEAAEMLGSVEGELVLDLSGVRRISPSAVKAIAEFAGKAAERAVKVRLSGVNVSVYKVLQLTKLASRFCIAG